MFLGSHVDPHVPLDRRLGKSCRKLYAAIKFVLYTMVGSLLMLVAILALYFMAGQASGVYTFDLLKLYEFPVPASVPSIWMFLAFFLAFAIKVPMFPFHTWLPDAHTEAPTVGSVVLAAVLLKMGTYGFIRYAIPLFPNAAVDAAWWVCLLAVIGIIYGAWVAMVQDDVKRLVAFSSVSHLGFVMLGMFAFTVQGVEGSVLQMINHGLSTGRSVSHRRNDLREETHPPDSRVRWAFQGDAHICGLFHDLHIVIHRAARPERIRGRVPHSFGSIQGLSLVRGDSPPAA